MQARASLTNIADARTEPPAAAGHSWIWELLLRLLGAALLILATLAIVRAGRRLQMQGDQARPARHVQHL